MREYKNHIYDISTFKVERSKGIRKCTECGGKIPINAFCLKGYLLDRCRHYMRERIIYMNKLIQLCADCVSKGMAEEYTEKYRDHRSEKLPAKLVKTVDTLKNYMEHPETYPSSILK
jgi:hypothetical protein